MILDRDSDVGERLVSVERKVDASIKCLHDLCVLVMDKNKLDGSEGKNLALKKDGTLYRFVDSENHGGSNSEQFGESLGKSRTNSDSSRNCASQCTDACACAICRSEELLTQCVNCDNQVCEKDKFWCAFKGCRNKICRHCLMEGPFVMRKNSTSMWCHEHFDVAHREEFEVFTGTLCSSECRSVSAVKRRSVFYMTTRNVNGI